MSSKNSPSLTSLRAFSVAGNCLSVTGAAQQLGVTQSAVSRQIKALEDSLEFKLFDRIGNSINLTAEGQAFHQKVFTIFDPPKSLFLYISQFILDLFNFALASFESCIIP